MLINIYMCSRGKFWQPTTTGNIHIEEGYTIHICKESKKGLLIRIFKNFRMLKYIIRKKNYYQSSTQASPSWKAYLSKGLRLSNILLTVFLLLLQVSRNYLNTFLFFLHFSSFFINYFFLTIFYINFILILIKFSRF